MKERETLFNSERRITRPMSVADTIGFDPKRVWYPLDGYDSYEISNDGYVRSTKLFVHEGGCLLRQDKNHCYNLVDRNGKKKSFNVHEIIELAKNNPLGGPRKDTYIQGGGRNRRAFQKKERSLDGGETYEKEFFPTFTTVPDYIKEGFTPDIKIHICPIYNLDGDDVYYGR